MDNSTVKKVRTLKSGYFKFSRAYSAQKVIGNLIEAQVLWRTIKDLPILPYLASQLEEEIIQRAIFSTAAIEGNPLTQEQVAEILSTGEDINRLGLRNAEKEIRNLKAAYDHIATLVEPGSSFVVTESIVKELHRIITDGVEHEHNIPGLYRNHVVKVGDASHGGIYTPPKILEDVRILMKEFTEWMNSEKTCELDLMIRAALAHYHLSLIHPFADGNGRTARIIEALYLRSAGMKYVPVMLSNFYYRYIDDYYWAFSKTMRDKENSMLPFLSFVLKGIVISLNEIEERITYYIRKFTLREYYAGLLRSRMVSRRQHELLIMLLESEKAISLNDLFSTSPFSVLYHNVSERTARRDLRKLSAKGSLTNVLNVENGEYIVNLQALG